LPLLSATTKKIIRKIRAGNPIEVINNNNNNKA
jgi:hypothetical protein